MTREIALHHLEHGLINEEYPLTKSDKQEILKVLKQEPTTKNDLAQERYQDLIEYFGDDKVAKTILESRKEFKAWLERIRWNVKRADEFARELEQIKGTTKNDLGVDYISRAQARAEIEKCTYRYTLAKERGGMGQVEWSDHLIKVSDAVDTIKKLPSVTSQEQKTGHWIKIKPYPLQMHDYKCSECGHETDDNTENYCSECGSRNEVEEC